MARQVAHDVKNPLTPIQLSAEHLRRVHADRGEPLGPILKECVETILSQVGLLRQISSEFSNFASSPTARPASVDLPDVTPEALAAAVDDLARAGVEGVVVVAGHDAAVDVARSRPGRRPVVVVEGDLSRTPMSVGVDQVAAAAAAVEHLVDLGHRRVDHVAGPIDWAEARARVNKLTGSKRMMSHAIFMPGNVEPQYSHWLAFSGTSVTLDGEQRYLDSHLSYQRACLHAIDYLEKFGYSRIQAYMILGSAPIEGRLSGVVDIPNSCSTVYIPTAIFDIDVRPSSAGPAQVSGGMDVPKASF